MTAGQQSKGKTQVSGAETPISRAIKRRKELQDLIKDSMKELEKVDEFLRMFRAFSANDAEEIEGNVTKEPLYILGRAGMGQAQPVFEQYLRATLLDAQRPLTSLEVIDAFRERGHPIGGNEGRTAMNRLWKAKASGMLTKIPKYGYWLADEPLPKSALD